MLGIILLVVAVVVLGIIYKAKVKNKFFRIGSLAFVFVALLYLCFFGDGTLSNGKIHISEQKMKVQFLKGDRGFDNSMKLNESKKLNVKSSCSEGQILLTVHQNLKDCTYDISKWDGVLELGDFEEGYVNLHLDNEDARNVDVEITCAD